MKKYSMTIELSPQDPMVSGNPFPYRESMRHPKAARMTREALQPAMVFLHVGLMWINDGTRIRESNA